MNRTPIKHFQNSATARAYRSAIAKIAREHVTARHANGGKASAKYTVRGSIVGYRSFHENGALESERPVKAGNTHGTTYRWDIPGELLSAEPYDNGLPHGIARQWDSDGTCIGMYSMVRGTGIDLWWESKDKLAEVHHLKDGVLFGLEWWIAKHRADHLVLSEERHWKNGLHGIQRIWNPQGRLKRGYPKYHVSGQVVRKSQYLLSCGNDPSLPRFRKIDNRPRRKLPAEIQSQIARYRTSERLRRGRSKTP
jgi:antitoxin component YwqK of YwqJK toxin-antitoxin module